MKLDRIPSPLPVFHRIGDQSAALLLQSVGVTIKARLGDGGAADSEEEDTDRQWQTHERTHYQLRSGDRGRLTKPPVPELAEAIHLFMDQGPNLKVGDFLPELLLAASLSLSADPYREVLDAAQESIDDAVLLHQIRDRPFDEKPESQNKVIPFQSRSEPK